ncbi:AI-2E family transporter [Anthocerotibacter panamensis]|uniref:AI-2E family transporter n=1 Tax=Anthocerotibacter panamensis TaxID=2857077 RepID=UPI001C406854|nr:AI-2E family transporter [Anthocerotibacter panamensis]
MWTPLQRTLVTALLVFLCGWALLETLGYFGQFLAIFVSAGIIAFLMDYPVTRLQKWMKRPIAGLVVYGVALLVLGVLALLIGPVVIDQSQQFIAGLPELLNSSRIQALGLSQWLASRGIEVNIAQIQAEVFSQISQRVQGVAEGAIGLTFGTFGLLIEVILALVIAFYMLLDGQRFWNGLMRFFPAHLREPFSRSLRFNLRVFFTGQLILAGFMTVVLTPVFFILGSPYPLLSGLFIGMFELLPFIGASIGIGLVFLLTLLLEPILAFKLLLAAVVVQQVKDNIVTPRVLGNFTGLSPILIFAALLLGVKIGGLLGAILAIPLTGVLKSLLDVLSPEEVIPEKST